MPGPGADRTGIARTALGAFVVYSAAAVAFTWPLARGAGSFVPSDVGDPLLNTWILWWNAVNVPLTADWWNAPIFFPAEGTMAFSEHLLGLTWASTPIIRWTGNPLLGHNVSWLLTFPLSATAAHLLAVQLTGRRDAAWLAGVAFGFSPYRVAQWSHLQVLAAYWVPIALLALHAFLGGGRRRWLVAFAAAVVMQILSNGYYLVLLTVLLALWMTWFVRTRTALVGIAGSWLAAALVVLPLLLTYRAVHLRYGLSRNLENMRYYSADLTALFSASPSLWLWSELLPARTIEGALFPGFIVLLLSVAGVMMWRRWGSAAGRSAFAFYGAAAVAMFVLALGPSPALFGDRLTDHGPYGWLATLPVFSSLRVPARFGMLIVLCLAVCGAIAWARLSQAWSRRARWIAASALALGMAAESWPRALPLWEPPRPWPMHEEEGRGPLLVVPVLNELNEAASMYRAMSHGRSLVNGYSGHIPPWYLGLREALNERDPHLVHELAASGVSHAAVVLRNDRDGSWREYVRAGSEFVRESPEAGFSLFALRRPATSTFHLAVSLPLTSIRVNRSSQLALSLADGRIETWWSTMEPQSGGEEILIDLGSPQGLATLEMSLGKTAFEFPRHLEVEVSDDLTTWASVWNGPTAGLAVGASMREPTRTPMAFHLRDTNSRYVRLRQTGHHRERPWTIAELKILSR